MAESEEHWSLVREIVGSNPGQVKPMTYKVDTYRFLARVLDIIRIGLSVMIMWLNGESGYVARVNTLSKLHCAIFARALQLSPCAFSLTACHAWVVNEVKLLYCCKWWDGYQERRSKTPSLTMLYVCYLTVIGWHACIDSLVKDRGFDYRPS